MPATLLGRLTSAFRTQISEFLEIDDSQNEAAGAEKLKAIIDDLRADLGRAIADRRRLRRAIAAAESNAALEEKAEAAIGLGREDLARALLLRRAEQRRQLDDLGARIKRLEAEALALEDILRDADPGAYEESLDGKLQELDALIEEIASNSEE